MELFGDRVRRLRKALGMTQAQLAKKAGFSKQSGISSIELNKHASSQHILQLAEALHSTPEYLLQGIDAPATELKAAEPIAPYTFTISDMERDLIVNFRKIDADQQRNIWISVEKWAAYFEEMRLQGPPGKKNGTLG